MDIGTTITDLPYSQSTCSAFGIALANSGHNDENIVVIGAQTRQSACARWFANRFPERFFNLTSDAAGSNVIDLAEKLLAANQHPLIVNNVADFFGRAYNHIYQAIALPAKNVKFVGSSGLAISEDGGGHISVIDLTLATTLPNFAVVVPADAAATYAATHALLNYEGPLYLRTSHLKASTVYPEQVNFEIGKAKWLREGRDVTLIACGLMVTAALKAAAKLHAEGLEARVLDMHTIKPLDELAVILAAKQTGAIVTAEEHFLEGGLGSAVSQLVARHVPIPITRVGLTNQQKKAERSQPLLQKHHLTAHDIFLAARQAIAIKQ